MNSRQRRKAKRSGESWKAMVRVMAKTPKWYGRKPRPDRAATMAELLGVGQ